MKKEVSCVLGITPVLDTTGLRMWIFSSTYFAMKPLDLSMGQQLPRQIITSLCNYFVPGALLSSFRILDQLILIVTPFTATMVDEAVQAWSDVGCWSDSLVQGGSEAGHWSALAQPLATLLRGNLTASWRFPE